MNTKFDKIQKRNLAVLKERIKNFEDSDSDDDGPDRSCVEKLFKNYPSEKSDFDEKNRVSKFTENLDCLICLRQIKARDKIWSCEGCYCSFHLICIQKWANDSMKHKLLLSENQPDGYYTNTGEFIKKKKFEANWNCPQCRKNYEKNEVPLQYKCYCLREIDPPYEQFLIPHSCGEVCNKALVPECGHRCLLLCHPSACPKCPQTIHVSCECKKSQPKTIRCSQKDWNCSAKCTKILGCKVHVCGKVCHSICPPCSKSRVLKCDCRSEEKEIKCEISSWKCKKVCGKKLPCKAHVCERKCHSGECGECPHGLQRECFCGKQTFIVENCQDSSSVQSCGDTCLKLLSCGKHKCNFRCHAGNCGNCKETVEKKCRCGLISKEVQCCKDVLCDTKCKNLRNCGKHSCNRKCCTGDENCGMCDKICGKLLSCGKHKCNANCHEGNCYPCSEKDTVKCRCGATTMTVNCGGKKKRIPKCKEPCRILSKCHHQNDSKPHYCHPGDCPNCFQVCSEILPCSHPCLAKCHDYVKVVTKDKNFKPSVPGEVAEEFVEMKKLPHPPCETKVSISCIGGHETTMEPCHSALSASCGRKCNRKLQCGNHNCQLMCHAVKNLEDFDEQDENCESCEQQCSFKCPNNHPCPKLCHKSSCKKCLVQVKEKCHCGLTEKYYRCCDVYKKGLDENETDKVKEKLLSCGSRCIKNYACGHQCNMICHKGPCEGVCSKKVKLSCKCKTRTQIYSCLEVQEGQIESCPCDDSCEEKRERVEKEKEMAQKKLQEEEEIKNKKELEEYMKKFGKKKYKPKEKKTETKENNSKPYMLITLVISFIILILALIFYFFLQPSL